MKQRQNKEIEQKNLQMDSEYKPSGMNFIPLLETGYKFSLKYCCFICHRGI